LKRRVVVRPEARAELAGSAAWYRERSRLVAHAFRLAIRELVVRIAEYPASFPEIAPGVRRGLVSRFPYAVFFAQETDSIVILSIKHQAQNPSSWPSDI